MKVSVIVPVYNTEKYLEKCLDSLVNQTLKDIEIIVVNDGSPDNSQAIIDKYQKKYAQVKGYKKKNGGLSSARNYGLKYAKGEYIGFIDSDDYANKTMFEKLYNKAKEKDFDVTVCDINYVYPDHEKVVSSLIDNDVVNDIKKSMINIYPATWNKMYKRSLFDKVNFKEGVWYEDVEFLYKAFPYIKSIGTIKEPLINYVQREGSIINTFDKRLYNHIDNMNGIVRFYKENGFYEKYYKELEFIYVNYLYCTFIINAVSFGKKEYNKAVKTAKENVKKQFPKYRHNKYFYKSLDGIYMVTLCALSQNMLYYGKGIIKKIFLGG